MKAIEFPEVNVRIAENQPEYETLPVYVDPEDPSTPTTMCIELEPEEIKQVIDTGRIWLSTLTFRQPFHPIKMSFLRPEGFTEPKNTKSITMLNEIAKAFHEKAKAKGFWDEPREIGTLLMLIVSELAEALEADRNSHYANVKMYESLLLKTQGFKREDFKKEQESFYFKQHIKDTFEDEIADTFIRLFDLVGHLGIDIDKHIELKMAYNETRPHKHGKAY